MKKIVGFICLLVLFSYGEVTHSGLTGTNIHTSFRWLFADSTARANQTVSAADTMKLAYQRSDSSTWVLVATTGTKWRRVSISQDVRTTASPTFNKITTTRDSTQDQVVTDSLKAVTGAFTGRVTGTDIAVSDTVSGLTAVFTNVSISPLTSYYMPYKAASGYLANSPFFTNGTNAAMGKGSVESWATNYRSLQVGGNGAILATEAEGTTLFSIAMNSYYDGTWKPMSDGRAMIYTFQGTTGYTWTYNSGLTGDIAYTPTVIAKIDTLGRFTSLRDSAQDVIATDTVKGTTVRGTRGSFDSVTTNGTDYFKYIEGTMACTLKTSDVTVQQIGTAYWTKSGNVLTISLPQLQGTSNSVALSVYCAIPYFPKQQASGYGYHTDIARVQDNGATLLATYAISGNPTISNRIIFNGYPTTTFTSSGTKGITAFSISYITE